LNTKNEERPNGLLFFDRKKEVPTTHQFPVKRFKRFKQNKKSNNRSYK